MRTQTLSPTLLFFGGVGPFYIGTFPPDPVVDENGNSITPDSLKKNMTIPAEAPSNDLEKLLDNINDANPPHKVENSNGLNKQLNEIAKRVVPDYSDADNGAVLSVVEEEGPEVAILDEDIGPDSPVSMQPLEERQYPYGKLVLVVGKSYSLEINGDGNVLSSIAEAGKVDDVYVPFTVNNTISYRFYNEYLVIANKDRDMGYSISKSHFKLTAPSVIKKLQWSK